MDDKRCPEFTEMTMEDVERFLGGRGLKTCPAIDAASWIDGVATWVVAAVVLLLVVGILSEVAKMRRMRKAK